MAVGHNSLKVAYVVWAFTFKAAQPHIKPFSFLPFYRLFRLQLLISLLAARE